MATKVRVGQINFNENFDIGGHRIINVGTPTAGTDVVNKNYVDNLAAGLKWKEPVRVATTGNITLSGTQTIDGVAVAVGDRVLVKDQTTASENGIYVVQSTAWTRSSDADDGSELASAAVFVMEGTTNADKGFVCTTDLPITIGTTNITFVVFTATGGYTAGNGIDITGNTISVKTSSSGGIVADASGVAIKVKTNGGLGTDSDGAYVDSSFVKGRVKEDLIYQTFTGDGSTTAFNLSSAPYYGSLNNQSVIVSLNGVVQKQVSGSGSDDYYVDTANNRIVFNTAPASGDIIVVYYVENV